ncbi:MAG: class-II fumarase/aspartase family protein [Gammaproteobacteria bacterium]
MIDAVHISDSTIYGISWSTPELRDLFAEQKRVRGWVEVMTVLAETQAEFGLIPAQAAAEIRACYRSLQIDQPFLAEVGAHFAANNHSLLGLIKAVQARCGPSGGEWLCYGATVQDITDTHLMRTLRTVRNLFIARLAAIEQCLVRLAQQHRNTVMSGRTHGQSGLPITFGYKAGMWLDELERHRLRLSALAERMDVGQLCGGVGSLSSCGAQPLALQQSFLARLGLKPPPFSWTTTRDRLAEWVNGLAMLAATADRIGHEVYNLQRPEIGELSEGFVAGTVGSITMPQKRNPEISEHLGTLSRVVRHHAAHMNENLVHDHERDGRSWKGEWLILPETALATGKALQLLESLLANLQVNAARMRENLERSRGFIHGEAVMLALAPKIGKQTAHALIYEIAMRAQEQGNPLKAAVASDPRVTAHLSAADLEHLFDLEANTGACAELVDRLIAALDLNAT